ncbi:hypothetical protein [Alkalilimnicola sp. S0819]|uniref:hypothetical protein n=1 Tax=Alkalilimnicola sp. S0819 TaxID=2613922 RepID=UPI0012628BB3|nr:hypothetical protein [Alkalilimnicola sp. S0819]KAB7619490.1 hypothetical protein F3N43_13685 [Alkalilimnicola sp. S0819]MPQ17688.1 hypothetical protein [Alkalilimnicola sp. S0819]
MLKDHLVSQLDGLIGPRLRLWRIVSFLVVVAFEALSRSGTSVFEAIQWPAGKGVERLTSLVGEVPLGDVLLVFGFAFFVVPRVAALLLARSTALAMPYAEPMLVALQKRVNSEGGALNPTELADLVRRKREALRLSNAIVDVFEAILLLAFWVVWPGSEVEFGAFGLVLVLALLAIMWACGGYALNYLVVTRVVPCDVLQERHAEQAES